MYFKNIVSFCLLYLVCAAVRADNAQIVQPAMKACPLESSCSKGNESSVICRLDEENKCIKQYESKCHMDVAACQEGKHYSDYSDVYCTMETYLCEETPTYERWTIFFGHVKD